MNSIVPTNVKKMDQNSIEEKNEFSINKPYGHDDFVELKNNFLKRNPKYIFFTEHKTPIGIMALYEQLPELFPSEISNLLTKKETIELIRFFYVSQQGAGKYYLKLYTTELPLMSAFEFVFNNQITLPNETISLKVKNLEMISFFTDNVYDYLHFFDKMAIAQYVKEILYDLLTVVVEKLDQMNDEYHHQISLLMEKAYPLTQK